MVGRIYDSRLSFNGFNIFLVINLLPIIAILFHTIIIKKIDRNFFVFLAVIIFLVFYSVILFNFYGINEYEDYSISKIIYFFLVFIPIIYFKYAHGLNNNFFFIFYIACFIFFIFGLSKITSSPDRMALFGGGPIVFARWIGIFAILTTYFIQNRIIKFLLILLSFLLIIKTGSKGPFLFLLVSFLFNFFSTLSLKKYLFFFSMIAIVAIQSTDFLIQILGPRLFSIFTGDAMGATSSLGRLDRWRLAIEVFLQNPFGVGFGNYVPISKTIESNDFFMSEYPHNLFLELISELGILGLLLVCIIIFKLIKNIKEKNLPLFQKQLLVFIFLNTMVSGDVMDARFFFLILL